MRLFLIAGLLASVLSCGLPNMAQANWVATGPTTPPVYVVVAPNGNWVFLPPAWAALGKSPGWHFVANNMGMGNVGQNMGVGNVGQPGAINRQQRLAQLRIAEQACIRQLDMMKKWQAEDDWNRKMDQLHDRRDFSGLTGLSARLNRIGNMHAAQYRLDVIRGEIQRLEQQGP